MAEMAPSKEYTELVSCLTDKSDALNLVFLGSGIEPAELRPWAPIYAPTGELLREPSKTRHVAVFYNAHQYDYVIVTDDGEGGLPRSWTVAADLAIDHAVEQYVEIPGFEPRDDLIVPYLGATVVGGMGEVMIEMTDAALAQALGIG